MLTEQQQAQLDWEKTDGLLPVVVQHAVSGEVLMLGYMNQDALTKTIDSGKVTFYSRTKQRLWTKGETSGHFLNVVSMAPDCDNDTLLVLANPIGPTCHKGTSSCFGETSTSGCSCINWSNCLQSVKRLIPRAPTPRSCTPAEPSVLHRRWVKKALKPHWPRPYMTARS